MKIGEMGVTDLKRRMHAWGWVFARYPPGDFVVTVERKMIIEFCLV
jgi:hypothetical protein